MEIEEHIVWLVGALLVFVLAIQVVIPAATTAASGVNVVGTNTGETWNGTAASAHALANHPIVSVTDFRNSTFASAYNDTSIAGNSSVNTTTSRIFTLSTPIDTGTVSANKVTVVVKSTLGTGSNVSVYANGNFLGVTTGPTDTWSGVANANPFNVTLVRGGANLSTVSNVTITYPYFAANTNYSVSNAANGQVTPTITGTFYTTYTYGTGTTVTTYNVILLLPLLIAVVVLMLFLKSSGYF